jgi:hypothetical protein
MMEGQRVVKGGEMVVGTCNHPPELTPGFWANGGISSNDKKTLTPSNYLLRALWL